MKIYTKDFIGKLYWHNSEQAQYVNGRCTGYKQKWNLIFFAEKKRGFFVCWHYPSGEKFHMYHHHIKEYMGKKLLAVEKYPDRPASHGKILF
jgi:hypothetical protein